MTAASKEAAVSQSEAATKLKVSRSSVERARKVIAEETPELVEKVDRGLIPVSTASKLLVLSQAERVKIASADAMLVRVGDLLITEVLLGVALDPLQSGNGVNCVERNPIRRLRGSN